VRIGIQKVEGEGWHPGQDDWFVRGIAGKVAWDNASRLQSRWGREQVIHVDFKCYVETHTLRCATSFPEAEHRFPAAAEPIESDPTFLEQLRAFESNCLAVKLHRAIEIGDGEVGFEESADGDHGCLLDVLGERK